MQLLDGKKLSQQIKEELRDEVSKLVSAGNRPPNLVAILVGDDGASQTYVNHKIKSCDFAGYRSTVIRLGSDVTEAELLAKVAACNEDESIDGMIVQLPLPDHIDPDKVINTIRPDKDVDGFHPSNIGKMTLGLPTILPATPGGIIEMLARYKVETSGKHCVVIGRSRIVGTPMSILMGRKGNPGNCTVSLTHGRTSPELLRELCLSADILIVAVGRANFVKADMVKPGATIIDVGITRVEDSTRKRGYRLVGDVDFESVKEHCDFITPVPGGVGPMTVAILLKNTMQAYRERLNA